MFLKYRYKLGFETLSREVTDSVSWSRFCRIPLVGWVPALIDGGNDSEVLHDI